MTREARFRRASFDESDSGGGSLLAGAENLFDVAIVFAVALVVALAASWKNPLLFEDQDFTAVVDPGGPDMELVVKEDGEIKRYKASGESGAVEGELLGRAYRLPDGTVVYAPTETERRKTENQNKQ
ncbi:MAG: DUF2149 domain-containing protein [Thermoguttaceae bacterium]|nr:DUF2149 domain-containing protein [Thermoguttaceae bacterium]